MGCYTNSKWRVIGTHRKRPLRLPMKAGNPNELGVTNPNEVRFQNNPLHWQNGLSAEKIAGKGIFFALLLSAFRNFAYLRGANRQNL